MSIRKDGVNFERTSRVGGRGFFAGLLILEAIFSFFLYLTLAGHIFAPDQGQAAAGVPQLLSYQGRLTDTSGNPLGGTGTTYCFRYSIYDAVSGGNKLWPSGTPTNATTTVVDGVFSDQVGRADTLNMDFFATSTIYLNVDVNTVTSTCAGSWESLTPRQQITAAGYALSADDVYGAALRTPTSTKVQIGTGLGVTSGQTLLSLDVKNTTDTIGGACSDNGALWYNSTTSRALVCEGGTIQEIGNKGTIVGFNANSTTTIISSGSIQLSGEANITINQTGNTLGFSVAAPGGGGGATISNWPNVPGYLATSSQYTGATGAGTNITASYYVGPLQVLQNLSFRSINMLANFATVAGTGSQSVAFMAGIYTLNGGTALSRLSSFMWRDEISQNSVTAQSHRFYWGTNSNSNSSSSGGNISTIVSGIRKIPLYTNTGDSLSAGQYWLIVAQTNRSSSVAVMPANSVARFSGSNVTAGNFATASTFNVNSQWLNGIFSSTTAVGDFITPIMPASIHTSVITSTGGSSQQQKPYINLVW